MSNVSPPECCVTLVDWGVSLQYLPGIIATLALVMINCVRL